MDCEKTIQTFSAIAEFTEDLNDAFKNSTLPLPFKKYLKGVQKLYEKFSKEEFGVDEVSCASLFISSFKSFLLNIKPHLTDNEILKQNINENSIVRYGNSETLFIDFKFFIEKLIFQQELIKFQFK